MITTVPLHFKKFGDTGPPLVILHGLLGSLDNWLTLGRRWADHFQVYLVDQRNHGRSPHTEAFGYPEMAADLRAFLEDQALDCPYLIGHSMGGKTLMQYAVQYPQDCRRMVVVDIAPKQYPIHHDHIMTSLKSLPIKAFSSRQEAEDALAQHITEPDVRLFLLKNLYRDADKSFAWRMNLDVLSRSLPTISVPVRSEHPVEVPLLFIGGERSNYLSPSDMPAIRELFPQSELRMYPTGHWVHAELPDRLYEDVLDFCYQK
ncbi:MAG: alpha/beta fold hydrolase [Bernardetiaceae bacterium]